MRFTEKVIIDDYNKEDIHPNGFNMNIKLHPSQTMQSLSDNGFTNYDPPTISYMNLVNPDLNVSIILRVNQETLKITGIDIMDEDLMQPYDYQNMLKDNPGFKPAVIIYHDVNKIMYDLQDRKIITGFKEGMYI